MMKITFLTLVMNLAGASQISELKCWVGSGNINQEPPLEQSKDINDYIECITKCREAPYCRLINMIPSTNPQCWYQRSVDARVSISPIPVTTYTLHGICNEITSGVDLNCWTVYTSSYMAGKTQRPFYTLSECFRECLSTNECWSVDWDEFTFPKCWVQMKPLPVSKPKDFDISTTSFVLNRDCLRVISGLDMRSWKVSDGMRYPSLTPIIRGDVRSCMDYCRYHEHCNMFDFDTAKTMCYVRTNNSKIQRSKLYPSENVYNFFLENKKVTPPPVAPTTKDVHNFPLDKNKVTPPPVAPTTKDVHNFPLDKNKGTPPPVSPTTPAFTETFPCWYQKNDTTYQGLDLVTDLSVHNLKDCLQQCINESQCKLALYNLQNTLEPCQYLFGPLENDAFKPMKGFYSYIVRRDCNVKS